MNPLCPERWGYMYTKRLSECLMVGLLRERTGNRENWVQIVRSQDMPVNRESYDEIVRVERSVIYVCTTKSSLFQNSSAD